jgi:hypothetical protein
MKIRMKNREAPFMCMNRVIQPFSTSRIKWMTDERA